MYLTSSLAPSLATDISKNNTCKVINVGVEINKLKALINIVINFSQQQ